MKEYYIVGYGQALRKIHDLEDGLSSSEKGSLAYKEMKKTILKQEEELVDLRKSLDVMQNRIEELENENALLQGKMKSTKASGHSSSKRKEKEAKKKSERGRVYQRYMIKIGKSRRYFS